MTAITITGQQPTMTSMELVEYINANRAPDKSELTHANFLAKVPKVLGEGCHSFECDLRDSYGRPRRGYRFQKREACLMAMSYSYELQARVFDHMTALEDAARQPVVELTQNQILLLAAQRLVDLEAAQQRQALEIAQLQETIAVVEARTQPENKHFTVMGYANLIGKPVDLKTAAALGKRCANLSREQGIDIGDVRDPRFGKVHTYHESILQAVLATA